MNDKVIKLPESLIKLMLTELTPDESMQFISFIMNYMNNVEGDAEMVLKIKTIWGIYKPYFEKMRHVRQVRANNGLKGGRPRKNKDA